MDGLSEVLSQQLPEISPPLITMINIENSSEEERTVVEQYP